MKQATTKAGGKLTRLCEWYGIDTVQSYGPEESRAAVSPDALTAVLRAMRVPASTGQEIEESLREIREGRAIRILEPVLISYDLEEVRVQARLPLPFLRVPLHWSLRGEDGSEREGSTEVSAFGKPGVSERTVPVEIRLPALPPGYYDLHIRMTWAKLEVAATALLVVAPRECYRQAVLADERGLWGVAAQLYSLHDGQEKGIGDYSALADLLQRFGRAGSSFVGVNPLHALPLANPAHASPYSPLSRLFWNVAYLDPAVVPEFDQSEEAKRVWNEQGLAPPTGGAAHVDYEQVIRRKRKVCEALYETFRRLTPGTERAEAFERFCKDRGTQLERFAVFLALDERFSKDGSWGWFNWPIEYRHPASPAVRTFAEANHDRIAFFQYLQWLCDEQLARAGAAAREHHMSIGLFLDLALGVDRNGSDVWMNQELYALDAGAGAPPDAWNRSGQNWGLPPMIPHVLREQGYAPFREMLRCNMRHAGALRLDHVMGLLRLFWVPAGMSPANGTYVHYPFEEFLAIVSLESHRHRCLVIGEDLGTVPDEVRSGMRRSKIFSYALLYFSKDEDGEFLPPGEYPQQALATPGTHDLPTLDGYWMGRDIALKQQLGLLDAAAAERELHERSRERSLLVQTLTNAGIPAGDFESEEFDLDRLFLAVCEFLAKSRAQLVAMSLEEVSGQLDQVNFPGIATGYPAWRHRLSLSIEALCETPRFRQMAEIFNRHRGCS